MEGYGEAWIGLSILPKAFSKGSLSSLGSGSLFSGRARRLLELPCWEKSVLFCKCWSPLRIHAPHPGGDGCLSFLPGTTDPDPSLGLHRKCLETVSEDHLSPLALLPYSRGVALRILGARERDQRGSTQQALLTQSHTAAYNGLSGPFVITAAIPWIEGVDFLLPLPQLCQLAFVSEGTE